MTETSNSRPRGPNTRAIHGGQHYDPATGAIVPPIYATSTFVQSAPGVHKGYEYARSQNPTRAAFEAAIADAEGGTAGFAFASGLAAEATLLELAGHGSHVVASEDLYGGSWRLFHRVRSHSAGLTVTHVDTGDATAVRAALKPPCWSWRDRVATWWRPRISTAEAGASFTACAAIPRASA